MILASCASIPGNNVKLKNYPEVKKEEIKSLDLSYENTNLWNPSDSKNGQVFNDVITNNLELNNVNSVNKNNITGCVVKISSAKSNDLLTCPIITNVIAPFTLFIIPLYCQQKFHAKATLVTTQKDPITNKPIIDAATNQPKVKVLKEYYLKDKAHEVWSIVIPFLLFNDTIWNSQTEKGWGSTVIPQTIAEALTRQILSDASKFPECQKR